MKCSECEEIMYKSSEIHYDELPDDEFCGNVCATRAFIRLSYFNIKACKLITTRTYIFPKNHSEKIFAVCSNFDRSKNVGRVFVEQFYPMSHYIKPTNNSKHDFNDEVVMSSEHARLMNHYLEVTDGTFNIVKE